MDLSFILQILNEVYQLLQEGKGHIDLMTSYLEFLLVARAATEKKHEKTFDSEPKVSSEENKPETNQQNEEGQIPNEMLNGLPPK